MLPRGRQRSTAGRAVRLLTVLLLWPAAVSAADTDADGPGTPAVSQDLRTFTVEKPREVARLIREFVE